MIKDNLPKGKWESMFPIKKGSIAFKTMINALAIGSDMLNLNLGFYHERRSFDNKNFAKLVLSLGDQMQLLPHIEELWEDCNNECEVMRRCHSRLTIPQIKALQLKLNT